MAEIAVLSDVHGNLNAYKAVLEQLKNYKIEACVLLGDLVDYGMRSNEVIEEIKRFPYKIICNICGNHENAILNENYERFSSQRGRDCAKHTRGKLNKASFDYLKTQMNLSGAEQFEIGGKKCLAVHGSLKDVFWKSVDLTDDFTEYSQYDYVFSGHSHLPHFFERYFACDNPSKRNKKKTVFINPGSVGQPRNINNMAQFAILDTDTEEIELKKVRYDVADEQSYFDGEVDEFYKWRLTEGV